MKVELLPQGSSGGNSSLCYTDLAMELWLSIVITIIATLVGSQIPRFVKWPEKEKAS